MSNDDWRALRDALWAVAPFVAVLMLGLFLISLWAN